MGNKKIAQQARDFLYELNNAKHEYSFSSTDTWIFAESTAKEKDKLESLYYPVLFTRCDAGELSDLSDFFTDPVLEAEGTGKKKSVAISKDRVFFVAYCASKLK